MEKIVINNVGMPFINGRGCLLHHDFFRLKKCV